MRRVKKSRHNWHRRTGIHFSQGNSQKIHNVNGLFTSNVDIEHHGINQFCAYGTARNTNIIGMNEEIDMRLKHAYEDVSWMMSGRDTT